MNGKIKFHKATGPAFNPGEVWVSSGGNKVTIVSVRKYPMATSDHTSDYAVTYEWKEKVKSFSTKKMYGTFKFVTVTKPI